MPSKIIPDYSYTVSVEGNQKIFSDIKGKLLNRGGSLDNDSPTEFSITISSNSFALAAHPFRNDLKIRGVLLESKIDIIVTRVAERKVAICFLVFALVICILAYFQKQQIKMLLFPITAYLGMYMFSFMAFHPAHSKIRKLVNYADEL